MVLRPAGFGKDFGRLPDYRRGLVGGQFLLYSFARPLSRLYRRYQLRHGIHCPRHGDILFASDRLPEPRAPVALQHGGDRRGVLRYCPCRHFRSVHGHCFRHAKHPVRHHRHKALVDRVDSAVGDCSRARRALPSALRRRLRRFGRRLGSCIIHQKRASAPRSRLCGNTVCLRAENTLYIRLAQRERQHDGHGPCVGCSGYSLRSSRLPLGECGHGARPTHRRRRFALASGGNAPLAGAYERRYILPHKRIRRHAQEALCGDVQYMGLRRGHLSDGKTRTCAQHRGGVLCRHIFPDFGATGLQLFDVGAERRARKSQD